VTDQKEMRTSTGPKRWLGFGAGLIVLFGMAAFFASGITPPGVCGETIRHNQDCNIDASPFFYGDVENIVELIEGAEHLYRYRQEHKDIRIDK